MGHNNIAFIQEGIKILDPKVQSIALLAKMLVRGLALGTKPWKVLLCHRVDKLRQIYKWVLACLGGMWLMIARKVVVQGFYYGKEFGMHGAKFGYG
jgi:hypothetical protein